MRAGERFAGGFLRLFSIGRIAFRVHWSVPIAALFAAYLINPYVPPAYGLVIVVHELGHAFFMRRYGLRVTSIDIHAGGGVARAEGKTTPVRHAVIAWGGILFQLALGALCLVFKGDSFVQTVSGVNIVLMVLNLLPIPGLDGWEAWPLFRHIGSLFAKRRRSTLRAQADELEAELARSLAREVERERAPKRDSNLLN